MKAYQADIAKFEKTGSQVLGISVDSSYANRRYAEDLGVKFPLLSDFMREVSKKYGILDSERNFARRFTFVVDKQGIIRHIEEGGSAIDPNGAYAVCSRLSAGG